MRVSVVTGWKRGDPTFAFAIFNDGNGLQTPTLKPVQQVGFAPEFPAPEAACQ